MVRFEEFGLLGAEEVPLVPVSLYVGFSINQIRVGFPASLQVARPIHSQVTFGASVRQRRRYKVEAFSEYSEFVWVQRFGGEIGDRILTLGSGRSQWRKT